MLKIKKHEKNQQIIVAEFTDESLEKIEQIKIIEQEFAELAKEKKNVKLILDFSNVWYLSSAVLGKLVLLRNWILNGKGVLKLASLRKDILDIFKITRLDKFFDIYQTPEEAAHAINNS